MHRVVFVVSPARAELLDALTRAFKDDRHVNVVRDQRVESRRHGVDPAPDRERRRYDRREHHLADVQLRERGWPRVQFSS